MPKDKKRVSESKPNLESASSNDSIVHPIDNTPIKSSTEKSIADISAFIRPPSLQASNPLPKPIPDWLSRPHTSFSASISINNLDSSSSLQQISSSDWISEQLKAKLIEIGYSYLFPGNKNYIKFI